MQVLQEGTRLADRYTLIRRLGAGGMAAVWLATDDRSDRQVALKFPASAVATDAEARKQLHKEWGVNSRLMHANIIRVFEFHDEADCAFYSLQYVGDANIGVVAGKDAAIAMRPVGLIADALRYSHAKGVVHRDIKASNILLDNRGAPYLIDFGVASPASRNEINDGSDAVSQGGSAIASSPQQLAGEAAQPGDDIFSLGVLIHELLTGVPPNRAESAQINVTLPDGSLMPPALQALLTDMLDYDPAKRPDAESVAVRLEEGGFPAGVVPPRYLAGHTFASTTDEAVDAIQPLRRKATSQTRAASIDTGDSAGITGRFLYGALGMAALLLVMVIFVLPRLVQDEPVAVIESGEAPADPVTEVEESGASVVETAPDPADTAAVKALTDEALGDLLSQMERLRYRAIERWGGQAYLDAVDVYRQADEAYVNKNYQIAGDRYRQASKMLEPFFGRIDAVFEETLEAAKEAFARSDPSESVRLYDLAVAITPGNDEAAAGLARALNLEAVLALSSQARQFEMDLELEAARTAFEKALALDGAWLPAQEGLQRVLAAIKQLSFEQRMTEGLEALAAGDFPSARAAFNAARKLDPASRQPGDGLIQVEQEIRLQNIRDLQQQAIALSGNEQWETAVTVYEEILKIDSNLQFAKEGLANARQRSSLHTSLQSLIEQPDNLSDPANIRSATGLLLDVTKINPRGPRLEEQKNELSRLLKRAATPLQVQLLSDNATDVSIFKVGRLGTFDSHELELRPGVYVAVGNRSGYRDVRIEFRVAPEVEMRPVIVRCEEQI